MYKIGIFLPRMIGSNDRGSHLDLKREGEERREEEREGRRENFVILIFILFLGMIQFL